LVATVPFVSEAVAVSVLTAARGFQRVPTKTVAFFI
jgi:hypothetical protein